MWASGTLDVYNENNHVLLLSDLPNNENSNNDTRYQNNKTRLFHNLLYNTRAYHFILVCFDFFFSTDNRLYCFMLKDKKKTHTHTPSRDSARLFFNGNPSYYVRKYFLYKKSIHLAN
jgi:hypothetical protein